MERSFESLEEILEAYAKWENGTFLTCCVYYCDGKVSENIFVIWDGSLYFLRGEFPFLSLGTDFRSEDFKNYINKILVEYEQKLVFEVIER